MLKAGLLTVFLAGAITAIVADKKIVCIYDSNAANSTIDPVPFKISDIDPSLCTHVIYADDKFNVNVSESQQTDEYRAFTKVCKSSPGTKSMISVGWNEYWRGWNIVGSGWNEELLLSEDVAHPELYARFTQNVINFLKANDFDGFDINWQFPNIQNSSEESNIVLFLKTLKEAFSNHGYILSVSLNGDRSSYQKYHIANLSQNVDFINLMTMNYEQFTGGTAINAPLSYVKATVEHFLSEGASADKLVVGIPFYGNYYILTNASDNGVGAPTRRFFIMGRAASPVTSYYSMICDDVRQGWTVKHDEQGSTYAFRDGGWVTYDDETSIAAKANYVLSNGLGGIMAWTIDKDDYSGNCGEKYPLLTTINLLVREVKVGIV